MDGPPFVALDGPQAVYRFSEDIHRSPENAFSHRHGDWLAQIHGREPPAEAFCRTHGDAPDRMVRKLLLDLYDQIGLARNHHLHRVIYSRDMVRMELDVDDRTGDLDHPSRGLGFHGHTPCRPRPSRAVCAPRISVISLVMVCCRTLLYVILRCCMMS